MTIKTGEELTAKQMLDLLAKRHSDDVFVRECTMHTQTGDLRLDAWVMKRSWAHPLVTGYEIKVSRSDFLHDHKWRGYLTACNQFWFVVPGGLVQPEEVENGVGLLWVKSGRFYTKKRPIFRDVQIPEQIFRYLLMARVDILDHHRAYSVPDQSDRDYWQGWMERKQVDHGFGERLRGEIARRVQEEIIKVGNENELLQRRVNAYEGIKGFLAQIGFDPGKVHFDWEVRQWFEEHYRVPARQLNELHRLIERMNLTISELEGKAVVGTDGSNRQ